MTRVFMGFSMNDEEGSIDTVQADSKRYQSNPRFTIKPNGRTETKRQSQHSGGCQIIKNSSDMAKIKRISSPLTQNSPLLALLHHRLLILVLVCL
jgi:hypothetical protein